VVGAGATADRSANQVVRPGCLGLYSRRRDVLTAAPQQDAAPLPIAVRRAPIRRNLSMTPRRCDALPSTDPVESMTEAAGYDLARRVDGLLPPHYIFWSLAPFHAVRMAISASPFGSTIRCGAGGGFRVQIRERRGAVWQNVGWMRAGALRARGCWECGVVTCHCPGMRSGLGATLYL
jgi:hypothetical protein